jgi:hypothetical protein
VKGIRRSNQIKIGNSSASNKIREETINEIRFNRFSFDKKGVLYFHEHRNKIKLIPTRFAQDDIRKSNISNKNKGKTKKNYHSDEDAKVSYESEESLSRSKSSIIEENEQDEESEEIEGDKVKTKTTFKPNPRRKIIDDDPSSGESDVEEESDKSSPKAKSRRPAANPRQKSNVQRKTVKTGNKRFKEDERGHLVTAKRLGKIRNAAKNNSRKKKIGTKTDREIDDFMFKEGKANYKSESESEESDDEDMKDKLNKMNKAIKDNIKPTFLINRNEDSIVDVTSENQDFSNDLDIKDTKKTHGMIKRDNIGKMPSFGPITDANNVDQGNEIVTYENPYDVLLSKLQLNFVPDSLPCRDSEKEVIKEFVMSGLRNRGSSTSLYISGMPGTGKTATTLEVIKKLNSERK